MNKPHLTFVSNGSNITFLNHTAFSGISSYVEQGSTMLVMLTRVYRIDRKQYNAILVHDVAADIDYDTLPEIAGRYVRSFIEGNTSRSSEDILSSMYMLDTERMRTNIVCK